MAIIVTQIGTNPKKYSQKYIYDTSSVYRRTIKKFIGLRNEHLDLKIYRNYL